MDTITIEQIRRFRLHTHHLDRWYSKNDLTDVVGACGFQNSPSGAWESALHNRISGYRPEDTKRMLETEKTLLQAWSFRGAPVVFPALESDAFLSALVSEQGEPWIYTKGIQLALDFLQMSFDELLGLLVQVMPGLDSEVLKSKTALDQTLAGWMLPLLPYDKRDVWNHPSMYGSPETQTVGGAVVSFLLRPCSFMGLVVFGKREGISPTFTSYKHWTGVSLKTTKASAQKLVRKYLHCFGPASVGGFAQWLGCSSTQAKRMWQTAADEMEAVSVSGKKRYILSDDKKLFQSLPPPERQLHLLGGHDPYLGLQDREIILDNTAQQRQIWQTVSNPGAVLWQGTVRGMWKGRKKGERMEIDITLWDHGEVLKQDLQALCDAYASQQQCDLNEITFSS